MSSVNVRNCIRFYQTAEELNAATLMNYCGEIIASHWASVLSTLLCHFYVLMHFLCCHKLWKAKGLTLLKRFLWLYCRK